MYDSNCHLNCSLLTNTVYIMCVKHDIPVLLTNTRHYPYNTDNS